jgi:uncharacterized RDD family membrane protein YckC
MRIGSLLLRRLGAYALDCASLFLVLAPLGFLIQRALAVTPDTGVGIYTALVLNFSLPSWVYFTWGDASRRGATPGKRLLGLRASTTAGVRIGPARALARTAVKMAPWEIAHVSSFLLAVAPGELGGASWSGLGLTYALVAAYVVVAWRTGGRRSVHDLLASTRVERARAPAETEPG